VPVFSNKWTLVLLAILAGVLIWNQFRPRGETQPQVTQRQLPEVVPTPQPPAPVENPPPATAESPAPPSPPAAVASAVISPSLPSDARVLPGSVTEIPAGDVDITQDLSAVDAAIRNFRDVLGENPIGSNAEITAALLGNNLKQIKLEVPTGSHVNGEGQMCDRWGTPYFFHQVSATEMEIRSAGPDRKMWTGDDSQM
jgi:hypothetical protein